MVVLGVAVLLASGKQTPATVLKVLLDDTQTVAWIEGLGGEVLESGESVSLSFTRVTDLSPLATMTSLERLDLSVTGVSDLSPLANLGKLEYLDLAGTRVANLAPLAKLTNLEFLDLENTPVTAADVAKLRHALPSCQINHQPITSQGRSSR